MSENDLKMVAFEFYWCCNGQSGNSSNSGSIISCFDANHKTRFCICFNMDKIINFGIPHVSEQIFESINTPELIKCLEVSKTWKVLAENVLIKRWKGRLFQACNRGYIKVVKLLLDNSNQIDLNARNSRGQTAFIGSCAYGQSRVVQFLLSHPSIEVNAQDSKGWTALMWAYTKNHEDIVKLLLHHSDRKIDLNERYDCGSTTFMLACKDGRKDMVKLFLDNRNLDIDLNTRDYDGYTAFMMASKNGHKDVVQLLVDNSESIELNARNRKGSTPFSLACRRGHKGVIKLRKRQKWRNNLFLKK